MDSTNTIIINCARTNSNLLQLAIEHDGIYLFFLKQDALNMEPVMIGEGEFIDFDTNPECREIMTTTPFTTFWDPDLLWSIATANEDHAITPLGLAAVADNSLWVSDDPDFTNLPSVAEVA